MLLEAADPRPDPAGPGGAGTTPILISALDASADHHAADLLAALGERRPHLWAFGAGGALLEKAGVEIRVPQRELAVAGLVEVLEIVPKVLRAWRQLERLARERRPRLAILVDAPDFHLPLARRLKRAGVPVLAYIGPNVMRWRRRRVRTVARRVDRLAIIFPYEREFYADTPLSVEYVGHPLVAPLRRFASAWDRTRARAALGLDASAPTVALAPGSRGNELRHMLPLQLAAARRLHQQQPSVRFVLCVAPTVPRAPIVQALEQQPGLPVELVESRSLEALVAADAVLAKPGTITLEAALLGCPVVVAGRAHPLTAALLRRLVHEPSFALPNVIAGAPIVPEFLQEAAQPQALADALASLLDGPARQRQLAGFAKVRERLGNRVAAQRTAEIADEMLASAC
jgi:lipid-A-disaccharide synthase